MNDNEENRRKVVEQCYPGVNESEAIGYARGYIHALFDMGMTQEAALAFALAQSFSNRMLQAGGAYTEINKQESSQAKRH